MTRTLIAIGAQEAIEDPVFWQQGRTKRIFSRSTRQRAWQRSHYATTLVLHLVGREFNLRYRQAFLGWAWAVAEPLARFAVLAFVFTRILPLGIPDYSAHLFSGLIAWGWFSSGLLSATNSPVERRELLMRPELPRPVLPLVAVLTDALDYVAALPVLAFVLIQGGTISPTALFLPVVLVVQLLLTVGLGYLLSAANVFLRDVRHMVLVGLSLLFYLTPIFYSVEVVPESFRAFILHNPMTILIGAYRAILVEGRLPALQPFFVLAVGCGLVCLVGLAFFQRASRAFLDEL